MSNQTPVIRQVEDFLSLQDFWYICRSQAKWFVVSVTLSVLAAAYYLSSTTDIYTRDAAVMVKDETTRGLVAQNAGEDFSNMALVQQPTNVPNVLRQYTSLALLTDVAARLNPKAAGRDLLMEAKDIRSRLTVTMDDEKSTVINLKYNDISPERAERVLSTIIDVFNVRWLEEKSQMAKSTAAFINDRLGLIESELNQVDDSISTFKTRHRITDLQQVSDLYLQQQTESEAEILKLTNQMYMAQYILNILKDEKLTHQLLPTHTGLANGDAVAMIGQYNQLLLKLKNNLVGTSAQNPIIIRQEAELADVRKNIIATIGNHIKTLQIEIQSLQNYNEEAKEKVSSGPDQAKRLISVERDQKVKESLYLYLLQKKEENEISMTYASMPTQVIDMPHGSMLPTFPNKRSTIMAAILFGLILPALVIFIKVNLDTTVRNKLDIESRTNIPIVGEIPYYEKASGFTWAKKLMKRFGKRKRRHQRPPTPLVVEHHSQDVLNEAFRLLRSNLEFMSDTPKHKNVYLVTSMYAGSGKTFVSMNLALALAIKGRQVLFIDGDLRRATATRTFGNRDLGLADYLGEKVDDISQVVYPYEQYPSLHILPVGTTPPNPTELLSSPRMQQLLEDQRANYDFILIDCPMTETLADASIIEHMVDRTLYVVRDGLVQRRQMTQLDVYVQTGKYKNLSLVLNAIPPVDRYTHGYKYYAYGYGYNYSS